MAIFTAIAGAVFGTGTMLAGIAATAMMAAAGVTLSLLSRAISGKPKQPQFSIQGTLAAGGALPRTLNLGYHATAGSLVYVNTWGQNGETPNAYFTQVICLGDMPVDGLAEVWINSEKVTLLGGAGAMGSPVAEYRQEGKDHIWVKFYDGTQTAADSFLTSTVSSAERPYQSSRVGRGCPYVIVTSLVNEELFTGFPQCKFALTGQRLYDISRDSTMGGSGSHRWGSPETWGGDGDHLPAVQIYNILRGVYFGGQWVYGLQGLPAARLPSASWIAAINKCRTQVMGAGGLEPQYRAGGQIPINAPVADAIDALLTACAGRLSEAGGIYTLNVGAPGAPSFAFSDADIISTAPQSFTPFLGLSDIINGVTATYPSPAEGWNVRTAPPIYRPDLEALAGNRRLMADVALDLVPYDAQVQRLMKSAMEEAQRARRHTVVLGPEFWSVIPGDIIAWASVRNGYEAKLFRVDGVIGLASLDVVLDLTEVDPSDYDWDHGTDYRVPVIGAIGPIRPVPQPMIDWFAEPWTLVGTNGVERPAIKLHWNADQPDTDFVRFQVRRFGESEPFHHGSTAEVAAGAIVITQSLLRNTQYQVCGRYFAISGRPTEWSTWLDVVTPDVRLGKWDLYDDVIGFDKLEEDFRDYQYFIGQGALDFIDEALLIAQMAADQDLANYSNVQSTRSEIKIAKAEVTAGYTEAITVATGPGSALAQRIETVEVALPGKADVSVVNLISATVTTQGGVITAQGNAITAVQATVNGISASANFRAQVYAGPAGYSSRIGLEARVGGAGNYRAASIFLDVPANQGSPTRVAIVAGQFVVTDGTNFRQPFIIQGGVVYAHELRATSLAAFTSTIGTFQTAASGQRTVMSDTLIRVYDNNNIERVRLGIW